MGGQAIAILGGGVSGLTLARTLADLGHTRVVVFEAAAEVGGKSCTIELDGRAHDLGATMGVPVDYRHVLGFSREAGIATEPFPDEQHYSLARGGVVPLNAWRELPGVLAQAAKYAVLHASAWRVDGRGLHRADPSLYAPWREVVERHGLHAANRRMLCYRTGYGYGFDDEVPAVMYANLVQPSTLAGLAAGRPFVWRGGTQPIWMALAARLAGRVEVRTATAVTRIDRGGAGVVIHSRSGWRSRSERFDRVAITCDPDAALAVLDASPTERRWFAEVRTYPYATFACEVEGIADGRRSIGYVDENMRRDRLGHPMAWVKRHPDDDIFVFHLFAPDDVPDDEIARRIAEDVSRLGGRLRAVRAARRWRFFPHFTSAFMRAGGLAELDRWQGQSKAYLVGEVLSFATMARASAHAVDAAHRIAGEPAPSVRDVAALARSAS